MTRPAQVSLLGVQNRQRKEEGSKGPGLGAGVTKQKIPDIETFKTIPPGAHEVRRENEFVFDIWFHLF